MNSKWSLMSESMVGRVEIHMLIGQTRSAPHVFFQRISSGWHVELIDEKLHSIEVFENYEKKNDY